MASVCYPQTLILVSARQNLRPSTTNIQCHLETGHKKTIPSFRNLFGVQKIKLKNLLLNVSFLKSPLDQNRAIFT